MRYGDPLWAAFAKGAEMVMPYLTATERHSSQVHGVCRAIQLTRRNFPLELVHDGTVDKLDACVIIPEEASDAITLGPPSFMA